MVSPPFQSFCTVAVREPRRPCGFYLHGGDRTRTLVDVEAISDSMRSGHMAGRALGPEAPGTVATVTALPRDVGESVRASMA
jgi:hypothetical protein